MLKVFLALGLFFLSSVGWSQEYEPLTQDQVDLIKKEFGIDVPVQLETARVMPDADRERLESELKSNMQNIDVYASNADKAIDGWIRIAAWALQRKGHDKEASDIENRYLTFYRTAVFDQYRGTYGAVGDHPPFSEWLAKVYDEIEAILGEPVMHLLHLDDIKTVNFTIPVVFQPQGDARFPPVVSWGQTEYKDHFVPFGGCVGYWTVYIACVFGTYGAGAAMPFICSPIGTVTRKVVERYVAPPISDKIYCRFNEDEC